jgi:hypothetical protein
MIRTYFDLQLNTFTLAQIRVAKPRIQMLIVILSVSLCFFAIKVAANPVLAGDYPERYTVVEGDTLWRISGRFLRDPWRWPEVWQGNPQVDNPDLIYPGDVLVMTFIDGKPVLRSLRRQTVSLSPKSRELKFTDTIDLIDPAAIQAYINSPLVTDENELLKSGYIVDGFDNRLLLGKYDKFYARGLNSESPGDSYRIFRPGRHFVDPVSSESLGWEAVHVGDADLLKGGDPAKLTVIRSYEGITIRDRLRLVEAKEALPFLFPKAPDNEKIRGVILDTPNKATEIGSLTVIAINLGEREGIHSGDVFRIRSQKRNKKDPITTEIYQIPEEDIGLAIVFRTFEKVSYALITDSNQQVLPGDVLVSPNAE